MASMRDIKRRRQSITSTQQITKAMKLVATVKLQRAKQQAERSQTYFRCMYETVTSVLAKAGNIDHPYLKPGASTKKAVIVITSNRGLAGGYNSNVTKLITQGQLRDEELLIYSIGKKGRDSLRKRYTVTADYSEIIEEPAYVDALRLAGEVLESYVKGEIGEIYLAYTAFKNTVVHIPTLVKLLPVEVDQAVEQASDRSISDGDGDKGQAPMNFEPKEEAALELLIPKYVTSLIYGGMVESVASENGARMQAMDSATSNAEEMIEDLSLLYNRARQGSI
ncbi:MAG: ATP synthase F1 subunit gamma, partial [Lachnospiraceae bacterium]|nr:ATP synthase F1 subunit gamma [Lachnospiraceae bacterium]